MEEGKQHPEAVQPMQGADPAGNHAPPATVNQPQTKKKQIVIAGILVLVLIIAGAILVFWVLSAPADSIVGTWSVESAGVLMQFDANGTATLLFPETGYYSEGRWKKVAENRYQLFSAKGTPSPYLYYDPVADTLHTDDFSMLLIRTGE